jgi:hypothetical protein
MAVHLVARRSKYAKRLPIKCEIASGRFEPFGLRVHLGRIKFREERREQRHGCLPRALCQPERAGLIAGKRVGEVARVTDVDAERRQPLRAGQPFRDGRLHAAKDVEEALNVMRLSKLDLMTDQNRLQVLLDSLLAVECNDIPEPISLGNQARGDIAI